MKPDELPSRTEPAPGARLARVLRWRHGERSEVDDWLTEEVPVALEFNGISHAVMLATPADLEDFALGFGLSEGLFDDPGELYDCEIATSAIGTSAGAGGSTGITVRMEVSSRSFAHLKERRRTLVGRTGCGVCGTESLDQVLRPVPAVVSDAVIAASAIGRAMAAMAERQVLCRATGSVHAAGWATSDGDVRLVREDVGRHNALDKLVGALARSGLHAASGFIVVTSRASVEMVQKACAAGVPLLAAVSAPTTLAVATAHGAGQCLVGLVRGDNLVIYSHPQRVRLASTPG